MKITQLFPIWWGVWFGLVSIGQIDGRTYWHKAFIRNNMIYHVDWQNLQWVIDISREVVP